MGRKPKEFTAEQRKQVEQMAKHGLSQELIAKVLGTSHTSIRKHCEEEWNRGSANGMRELVDVAHQRAFQSDSVLIFLLKTRLGWRETSNLEATITRAPIKLAYTESGPDDPDDI